MVSVKGCGSWWLRGSAGRTTPHRKRRAKPLPQVLATSPAASPQSNQTWGSYAAHPRQYQTPGPVRNAPALLTAAAAREDPPPEARSGGLLPHRSREHHRCNRCCQASLGSGSDREPGSGLSRTAKGPETPPASERASPIALGSQVGNMFPCDNSPLNHWPASGLPGQFPSSTASCCMINSASRRPRDPVLK